MKNVILFIETALAGLVLIFAACNNNPLAPTQKIFEFSFEQGVDGWTGGFADYPLGEEAKYELEFQHAALPAPLDNSQKALRISGRNYSDDLFMFIKKKISGLDAHAVYSVTFELKIGSDAPNDHVGTGGAPAIPLKVGAAQLEPAKVAQGTDYVMNIDKGQQLDEGRDMKVIGNTGNGTDAATYALIERNNSARPFKIRSDENGEVWVIIGTDSNYESTTTLYYDSIHLKFE